MNWWESIILGLVQGLTEFLPVSSSGHLVLGQYLLGLDAGSGGVLFEVMVHFGTIMSVFWVYRARIGMLMVGVSRSLFRPSKWDSAYRNDEDYRLGIHILIPPDEIYGKCWNYGDQDVGTQPIVSSLR